jgi:hypothetical protein
MIRARLAVDWPGGTVLSMVSTVHHGARAAAVFAPGMFRIDVTPHLDTVQIQIRNLSPVELRALPPERDRRVFSQGEEIVSIPGQPSRRIDVRFDLGEDFGVWAVITTSMTPEPGTIQVISQALIRPRTAG